MKNIDFYDIFSYVALIISLMLAFYVSPLLGLLCLPLALYVAL